MLSSVGDNNEAWQGEEEETSLYISHLLNDADRNRGVSAKPFEMAPVASFVGLEGSVSSGYSQGSRQAASFCLAKHTDGGSPENFCEQQLGGFKDEDNPLVEEKENFQMSPEPAGCNSLFFCGNDESASESLDPSSEDWMADCLKDVEIPSTSDDLNAIGEFDYHFDISDLTNLLQCDIDAEISEPQICPWDMDGETSPSQITPGASSHLIGEKRRGAKKAKAKALLYPFALVKPCGVQGDVTLTDINRRIGSSLGGIPHIKECSSSQAMHVSAFTGKPVVSRTKVQTEGNGSIVVIRTRG